MTWFLTFWLLGVCGISGFIGYIKGHVDGWNEAFRWHMERGYHDEKSKITKIKR